MEEMSDGLVHCLLSSSHSFLDMRGEFNLESLNGIKYLTIPTERPLVIRVKESEALRENSGNDNEEGMLSMVIHEG